MIEERCSCGARFKTDESEAVKLVRDWRRNHACVSRDEISDTPTSGSAQVEMAMGFQPREMTFPNHEPDWEED
jgi:hypothetical protein